MATPSDAREPDFERLLHGARIMAVRALGDRERAEEIALDARARVFAAWQTGRIQQPECIGAYLCTVTRNLIADELRRVRRALPLDEAADNRGALDAAANALDALVDAEAVDRVRAEIGRLEPDERALLLRVYEQELNCAEIALLDGVDAARVRKRLERLKKKLKDRLSGPPMMLLRPEETE